MPSRRNNSKPPKTMTWSKAVPVLIVCIIFDALRMFFEQFWFFGPALAAAACTGAVSSWVGSLWGLTAAACTGVAAALGYFGAAPIETFGVIMAMAVGLMGWLTIGLILILTDARIFEENAGHALWFAASLLVSEVPIVGTIPALTIIVWRMYRTQIHKEAVARRQYESEQAATLEEEREERQRQATELMRARAAELAAAEIY